MATVQEHLTTEITQLETELAIHRDRRAQYDIVDEILLSGDGSDVRARFMASIAGQPEAVRQLSVPQRPQSIGNGSFLAWYDSQLQVVERVIARHRARLDEARALGYLDLEWPADAS